MENLRQIRDYEDIKLLSDAHRLAILRLLMAAPATLTHLGQTLTEHPAQIRHHVKLLEQAGLVELVETRVVRGFVEKYYRARARAFMLQQLVLPSTAGSNTLVVMGSHDLALELLAAHLHPAGTELLILPVGSLDGLVALRQGMAHIAGCHLLDTRSGEYNRPFVHYMFPDMPVRLVTLAQRHQGLLLPPGNPQSIHSLPDLARSGANFINRNRGSGTRLWLDAQLTQLGLAPAQLHGYEREARTHTAVAELVRAGRATAGIGLQAAAIKYELDFVPLFSERFDLALAGEMLNSPHLPVLLATLRDKGFREQVQALGGYEMSSSGDEVLFEV